MGNFNDNINTYRFLNICISIIVLYGVMPIVPQLVSSYLTTYFYMVVLLITAMLIVLGKSFASLRFYIAILLPFILWKLLLLPNRSNSILQWGYSSLLELIPIVIGYYIVTFRKKNRYLPVLIVIAIVVTCITTIIALKENPDAARWLATVADSDDPQYIKYSFMNIGGYEFVFFLVLLYPILIWLYKQRKIKFVPTLLLTILCGWTIYVCSYATAFLLFIVSSIFFFVKKDLRPRDLVIIAVVSFLVIFLFSSVISAFFMQLAKNTVENNMSERLRAIAGGLKGIENSESDRLEKYLMSLRIFFKSPLTGNMINYYGVNGGHSFIFDFLADFGLVGAGLLFAMYSVIYTIFYKPLSRVKGYGYIQWAFIQAILLSTINTGMWISVLTMLIPIILSSVDVIDYQYVLSPVKQEKKAKSVPVNHHEYQPKKQTPMKIGFIKDKENNEDS